MEVADKGGDKFHITPDLRKGSITLFKGPDDQLMHFAWKERPSGTVVDVSPFYIYSLYFVIWDHFVLFVFVILFLCFFRVFFFFKKIFYLLLVFRFFFPVFFPFFSFFVVVGILVEVLLVILRAWHPCERSIIRIRFSLCFFSERSV